MALITNQWDRDNLMFLLTAEQQELDEWNKQATSDDLAYAQELLNGYAEELKLRSDLVLIEAEMEKMVEFEEAQNVINRVKV